MNFFEQYIRVMPRGAKNHMTWKVFDPWLYGWYCAWSFHVKRHPVSQDEFRRKIREYAPEATLHEFQGQKEWRGIRFEGPPRPNYVPYKSQSRFIREDNVGSLTREP